MPSFHDTYRRSSYTEEALRARPVRYVVRRLGCASWSEHEGRGMCKAALAEARKAAQVTGLRHEVIAEMDDGTTRIL